MTRHHNIFHLVLILAFAQNQENIFSHHRHVGSLAPSQSSVFMVNPELDEKEQIAAYTSQFVI